MKYGVVDCCVAAAICLVLPMPALAEQKVSPCFPGLTCSGNAQHAQTKVQQLGPGAITLDRDTFWEFDGVHVANGTKIITNGNALVILAQEMIIDGVMTIASFETDSETPTLRNASPLDQPQNLNSLRKTSGPLDGRDAGLVKITVLTHAVGHLAIKDMGESGLPGKRGITGINGRDGASGTDAIPNSAGSLLGVVFGCSQRPGRGLDGEPGGPGGPGERGGDGGKGGDVLIAVPDGSELILDVDTSGGAGGAGGPGGPGGPGGKGGSAGQAATGCADVSSLAGQQGRDGPTGEPGTAGKSGAAGSYMRARVRGSSTSIE